MRALSALLLLGVVTVTGAKVASPRQGPWTSDEALAPADLAATVRAGTSQPTIVYVGYQALFRAGHIPGATFHGPASQAAGLTDLKEWAAQLAKDRPVVLYCGCCPLDDCPNVAPAYEALKQLGLTKVQVLVVPVSFAVDWVDKGYPIER